MGPICCTTTRVARAAVGSAARHDDLLLLHWTVKLNPRAVGLVVGMQRWGFKSSTAHAHCGNSRA